MSDSIPRRIPDQTESTTTEALCQCRPLNVADKNELGSGGEMRPYAKWVSRSVPWGKATAQRMTSEVRGSRIRPMMPLQQMNGFRK